MVRKIELWQTWKVYACQDPFFPSLPTEHIRKRELQGPKPAYQQPDYRLIKSLFIWPLIDQATIREKISFMSQT